MNDNIFKILCVAMNENGSVSVYVLELKILNHHLMMHQIMHSMNYLFDFDNRAV